MEALTVGQIAAAIALIAALISGLAIINSHLKKWLRAMLREEFDGIKTDIKDLDAKIDRADLESCKNYLVASISDLKRGQAFNEVEKLRFKEELEHYKSKGGNSYIKDEVERLKTEGKL